MIDIGSAIAQVCAKMKNIPIGSGVRLATFKKDRHISVIRCTEKTLEVHVAGFDSLTIQVEEAKLKKTLKPLVKREFPRSNKAHLSVIASMTET